MEEIYNDETICVSTTGHDFDFIAIVENKTDANVLIDFYDTEESLHIKPHDYIGLLADETGRFMLEQFINRNFLVYEEE